MNFWFQAGISHLAESLGWWRQPPPVAMNPTLPNSFLDTFRWQIWWLSNLGTFVNPIEFCDLQPVGFSFPSSWRVKHRNRCLAGEAFHRASVIIHRLGLAKAWDDRWDSGRGASGKWEEDLKAVECLGSDYEQCEQERMWWRKGPIYWRLFLPKHAMIQCQWLKKTSCSWSGGMHGNAYGHVSQRNPSCCDIKGLTAKFEDDRNGQDSYISTSSFLFQEMLISSILTLVLTWLKLQTRGMSQAFRNLSLFRQKFRDSHRCAIPTGDQWAAASNGWRAIWREIDDAKPIGGLWMLKCFELW